MSNRAESPLSDDSVLPATSPPASPSSLSTNDPPAAPDVSDADVDSSDSSSSSLPSVSPLAVANTAGNAVSLAGDVPVSSFSTAWRLSAQLSGSIARTSVIWLNHLLRIFAPVYRMPLKAFRPVSMRPFDNLKQRAWAHDVRRGKVKGLPHPPGVVSPSPSSSRPKEHRYERIGAIRALRTVYAAEGFLSLIRHLSPALLANVLLGTVMFTSYEAMVATELRLMEHYPSSLLTRLFAPSHSASSVSSASIVMPPVSYPGILLAGAFSGLTQSLVIAPIQAVNCHYEHHHYLHTLSSQNPNEGSFAYNASLRPSHHASLWHIMKEEGVRGVFRGWPLTAARDTLGMGAFFLTFQAVKNVLVREERFGVKHRSVAQFVREKRDELSGHPHPHTEEEGDESLISRELGWSHTHVANSVAIVFAGICAGFAYRLSTHPFVVLQHRRDRDYIVRINEHLKQSHARLPLLCFSHQATGPHYTHPPAWGELLQQYRKEGLSFLRLDPDSKSSVFGFPKTLPSLFNRLTLIFTPSVVGLLSYELTKQHHQQDVHQH